ncbi:hypothetical protein [Metabacillus iocasae]|uniref:Uncharacterized protein n=1 Tax=Priestia iocasae TaxID=2291674 RepID=A0ABS2QUS7_9BACI|nr:hypothetical protein [Metabacillus iocasae]MBM7703226.1 hypothetical protein [Metabacillus iocasae]
MTKKFNNGSSNQSNPKRQHELVEMGQELTAGDNSKGNKRNKDQRSKTSK